MKFHFIIIGILCLVLSAFNKANADFYDFESNSLPSNFTVKSAGNPGFVGTTTARYHDGYKSLVINSIKASVSIPLSGDKAHISWWQYDAYGSNSPIYMVSYLETDNSGFVMQLLDSGWGGIKSGSINYSKDGVIKYGPARVAGTWTKIDYYIQNKNLDFYVNNKIVDTIILDGTFRNIKFSIDGVNVYNPGGYWIDSFTIDPINAICGSSNMGVYTEKPITNLCSTGIASDVTGTGPWSWTCSGLYGGTNSNCATFSDLIAPQIDALILPEISANLEIPITTLTASDNVDVSGYLLSESATIPSASTAGWNASKPTTYTFTSAGNKTLYASVKDSAGNISAAKSATVAIDMIPPKLVISTLANGAITNKTTLNICGIVSDNITVASLSINNSAIAINQDGSFSHAITLVSGDNRITTVVKDTAGNVTIDELTIIQDLSAPKLTVTTPADNSKTAQVLATVTGTVDEASTVVVKSKLNGSQNAAMSGNSYSATVNLESGLNTIDIIATDFAGNNSNAKRTVLYDPLKPSLAITSPDKDVTVYDGKVTITGTADDTISGIAGLIVKVDDKEYYPSFTDGKFSQPLTFMDEKLYPVTVTVVDEAGNSESVTRNVIFIKGTIVINGGAVYTANSKVTLSLGYYPSAAKMQLYYNGKAWTKPEPFAATKIIHLPKGDGLKTVQVRYLDANGTTLGEYTASITMDTVAPSGAVKINGGALYSNSRDVNVEVIANDITSGISKMCIKEDLPCGDAEFESYVSSKEYTIKSALAGKKTIYVTLKDLAGKISKPLKATITLDTTTTTGSVIINKGAEIATPSVVDRKLKTTKASKTQLSLEGVREKFVGRKKVILPSGAGNKKPSKQSSGT